MQELTHRNKSEKRIMMNSIKMPGKSALSRCCGMTHPIPTVSQGLYFRSPIWNLGQYPPWKGIFVMQLNSQKRVKEYL